MALIPSLLFEQLYDDRQLLSKDYLLKYAKESIFHVFFCADGYFHNNCFVDNSVQSRYGPAKLQPNTVIFWNYISHPQHKLMTYMACFAFCLHCSVCQCLLVTEIEFLLHSNGDWLVHGDVTVTVNPFKRIDCM